MRSSVGSRHAFRLRQAWEHAILRHPEGCILELGEACLDVAFSLQNLLALEDVVFDGAVAPVAVAVEVIEKDAVPLARRIPWLRTETPLMGRHVSGGIGGRRVVQLQPFGDGSEREVRVGGDVWIDGSIQVLRLNLHVQSADDIEGLLELRRRKIRAPS